MIDKTERINHLMDFYAPLLTEKQLEVLEYAFREDYSLSEIAEIMEVSRSAVHDLLKRCEATLEHYEDKLHLFEKFQKRLHIYDRIKQLGTPEVAELVEECILTE